MADTRGSSAPQKPVLKLPTNCEILHALHRFKFDGVTRPLSKSRTLIPLALLLIALLAACTPRGLNPEDLPTAITDLDAVATQQSLTRNAPPPRYRDGIAYEQIDKGLDDLAGWRYTVNLVFDGVFTGTPREVHSETTVEVWYAQLGDKRRVVVEADGALLTDGEPLMSEGVRIGDRTFLVQDGTCTETTGTTTQTIADVGVGTLLGGVREAVPAGQRGTINGEAVWRYAFLNEALNLPSVELLQDGGILSAAGELWFAPEHEAVVRFYLTLQVENAVIFGNDSAPPVTGQVVMRYDLYDVGQEQNISIPFGC